MRAHWLQDLRPQETYALRDADLHHLVNVVRIEAGEELLLLNGAGLMIRTRVESLSKKELRLSFQEELKRDRNYIFDLILGMPKREALELCLKQATELGFRRIYLVRSEFSQMRFPEKERAEKLMISALEQSNSPYLPELIEAKWEEVPWNEFGEVLMLDSQTPLTPGNFPVTTSSPRALVIGPEGGFSPAELELLHALEKVRVVNLPTPILRTPTALAVGAGLMIESLLK